MFQASRAAGRTVKIGMVSPQTGPIAAFGEEILMGSPLMRISPSSGWYSP